ncbi:MAG: TonB-dependent receptor, partial [Acidobacteriia bacterium]|nr:TonB-dependent receptor [Terriglobia bacterium]
MRLKAITASMAYGVILLLVLTPAPAPNLLYGQTSFGMIVGTVTDSSQAVVPGVTLIVTNAQTGISRQVLSDQAGDYRVESILPGEYIIKAQHPSFRTTEIKNVQVPVAVTVTVNIVLQVGAMSQSIEVTATPPLLETANATVGTVVNQTSVVTLPLDGRNFTDLIGLMPGAVNSRITWFMISGANYSVSGNRYEQNNYTLDGAYNNEEWGKQFAIQPSIDAIQEFKIQTNITTAEFGQAAGANVNVATKSGTNQLHGAAFEFLRNDKLDANDWFRNQSNIDRPAYKRNQYGGVIGGPVYLPHLYNGGDRSFWFFNYEGTEVRRGSTIPSIVPTQAQWSGDLRDQPPIYDPLTTRQVGTDDQGNPIFTRDPIQCNGQLNVICPDRIDPWIKAYADVMYPMISAPPGAPFVQIVNTKPFMVDQYQWTIRADQKLRENLSFFARMSLANGTQTSPQSLPALSNYLTNNMRNFAASWTLAANPTTIIDWRIAYHRTNMQYADSNPAPGWEAFLAAHPISGTPVKSSRVPLYPTLAFCCYTGPGQAGYPFVTNIYQALGSFSKIKGRHSIKAGVEFTDMRNLDDDTSTSGFGFDSTPAADPQNVWETGSSLGSLLLGLPSYGNRNLGETEAYMRQERWHFYVQEDIKVSRKLTLNAGLRYEYNQWPVDRWDRSAGFDPTTPPNGAYLWAGYNAILNQGPNVRRSIRDPDFNNFAPRVGLAYSIAPKSTFRAGYGIFYVANYLWEDQGARGN